MTTWFPYLIDPTDSSNGDQADVALTDFANSRVIQLTSGWDNMGGTSYDDRVFVSSSIDGSYTSQHFASAITSGGSGNKEFDGANGGRCSRIGTDGKLYVTTANNTPDFSFNNWGLSKIDLGSMTETGFMVPSAVFSYSDPVAVPFKIGSTNYLALAEDGVGNPAHVEVINVDTMTSVGSVVRANGNSNIGGFVLGGAPDANSVEFFIVTAADFFNIVAVERVVYSTMTGFSSSTVALYPPWFFDYRWTDYFATITHVTYDPNGPGLIFQINKNSAPSDGTNYLIKIPTTSMGRVWQLLLPNTLSFDYWPKYPQSDVSNGHLFFPYGDYNTGQYLFVDTTNGYTATGSDNTHLHETEGEPTYWDGPNNRLTYQDGGSNDSNPPTWYNGWANYDTAWVTPTTPPATLVGLTPSTFDVVLLVRTGSTVTLPSDPPFPGMALSSGKVDGIGGGQAATQGANTQLPGNGGVGGKGADWAETTGITSFALGQTLAIQIGLGGTTAGAAGTSTWLKDIGGTKILQAKGANSGDSNIGTNTNPGGNGGIIVASYDGSYGNVLTPGFGGSGGGSAGGPDSAPYNGVGSNGGDTNFAVGQPGGTGGGCPMTNGTPPWDAPGQYWFSHGGSTAQVGYSGGRNGPPFGYGTASGANNPFGTLDGTAGAGCDSGSANPLFRTGGSGRGLLVWFDSYTGDVGGPGGGGGGGTAGYNTDIPSAVDCGDGGKGGTGAGGGGSGGTAGPIGASILGQPSEHWTAFTGALATPGHGGDGIMAITLSFTLSGSVDLDANTQFTARGSLTAPNSVNLSLYTTIQIKGRLANFALPPPPPPPPPPPIPGLGPFDWRPTVISQYQNSPILLQLLKDFHDSVDPSANLDAFFQLIWNVDTAVGYGLDVWGRIVGVTRTLSVASGRFFGFQEGLPDYDPFNVSPFWNGAGSTTNYNLSDDAFRTLIFAKALANISDGSIKAINQLLLNLFPGLGNCYVTDGNDMTMTYTFEFLLTPVQLAIIQQSGVLPKSTGVSATVVVI